MANKFSIQFDFPALQAKLLSQFRNLDPKEPHNWPVLPRYAFFACITIVLVVGLWFAWLNSSQ